MKTKFDYIKDIFACILQNGQDAIDFVLRLANTSAGQLFPGNWHKLYKIIFSYFRLTGKIISRDDFIDCLNTPSAGTEGKSKRYTLMFDQSVGRDVNVDQ